ncbi:MAG: DNA repair protein RecO [Verrucomicrobiota bacterium]
MDERSTGLILRVYPLTETSLIVHWLTPDAGRIATVAKGARRPKSPFLGKLDLYFLADFAFYRSRRSELHTLKEVRLRETHRALREDLACLQQAAYCACLIEQTTEKETPLPGPYELLLGLLVQLTRHPPQALTIFAFEMKLLQLLGLRPDFRKATLSDGGRQILEKLLVAEWPLLARLKPSEAQNTELGQYLHDFLIFNLGKVHRSREGALSFVHSKTQSSNRDGRATHENRTA